MTTEALKSFPIVDLDSTPIITRAAGSGASGTLRSINAKITITAGVTSPSTYRVLRVPPDIKVKHVFLTAVAQGAGAVDIGIAFSDSLTDGTQSSFTALSNPMISDLGPG